jgi:hypothetical protein
MSGWPATERYGLAPAEAGLALAQELINTKAAGGRADLLADPAAAGEWGRALGMPLTGRDLPRLRALRAAVAAAAGGPPARGRPAGTAGLRLDPATGLVELEPRGTGARSIAAEVLTGILLAQRDGSWARLKLCRKPACAVAFYDRSRNNSGAWHDVRTCGNQANLRASRARRRASTP